MKLWLLLLFCLQISKIKTETVFENNTKKNNQKLIPMVITTWGFLNATMEAWSVLEDDGTALDAVEVGCSYCESHQCDGTVGYGGSPDENGETTLDALIMDGATMNVGAVASLRRVKSAAAVARLVLDNTEHSLLVGDLATQFAVKMGFTEEPLDTPESHDMWREWRKERSCQPNFWRDVVPDHTKSCGPYRPAPAALGGGGGGGGGGEWRSNPDVDRYHHDTIGVLVVDSRGDIAAGTSTNGARFKIPGRVGDSPIAGAGAYAENSVGGAAATGDGDVMMRFLPSFVAVEAMRRGATPMAACKEAIGRITRKHPRFMGAVVAVNAAGEYGAACHGLRAFPFVIINQLVRRPLKKIICVKGAAGEIAKLRRTSQRGHGERARNETIGVNLIDNFVW